MSDRSTLLTTTRDTLAAHVRAGHELDAYATEGCEAQGVPLGDLPRLGDVVARAAADLAKLYEGVGHPMWLPSVADALGMDEPFQATASDVLAMVRDVVRRAEMAAARWEWTHDPDNATRLGFYPPGAEFPMLVAVISTRPDGMLSVITNGQKRTAADDLPAALATIRAVLGADVPEIPNERSES